MSSIGGIVAPNAVYGFDSHTRLVIDETLGHVFESEDHRPKLNNLRDKEHAKRLKYVIDYRHQGLAFAPLACNTWGQLGNDFVRFLWILADKAAHNHLGLNPLSYQSPLLRSPQESEDSSDIQQNRSRLFRDYKLQLLTAISEAVAERVLGRTFALSCTEGYQVWLQSTREQWLPLLASRESEQDDMEMDVFQAHDAEMIDSQLYSA